MPRGFFAASRLGQSKAPPPSEPYCGACGLYKTCRSPKMPWSGAGRRRVLIVAEAPGPDEDATGTQQAGKVGQYLRRALFALGVDLDRDCWTTNTLICMPQDGRKPTGKEISYCRPNLLNTIQELQPEIIILLGGTPLESLVGYYWKEDTGGIALWAGARVPHQRSNTWICPTFHPLSVMREEEKCREKEVCVSKLWWERHLAAAFGLTGRPWPVVPDYRGEITRIMDPGDAAAAIDRIIEQGGPCAFDYETNMLKPDGADARIVSVSICHKDKQTIAYPYHGAAIAATKRFLQSNIPKIASNMKFEDRWSLAVAQTPVANWYFDTMQGAHLLDSRPGVTSIKYQAFVRLGFERYDTHIEPYLKTRGSRQANQVLREIDIMDLLLYNGLDSLLEYRVAKKQTRELNYPPPR